MSDEDDIRALLAAARADDGPPLGIDAAGIVDRGRSIARRRRRLAVLGSSAATVLVVGLLVGMFGDRQDGHVTPANEPSVTHTPTTHTPADRPRRVPLNPIGPLATLNPASPGKRQTPPLATRPNGVRPVVPPGRAPSGLIQPVTSPNP